jgi:PKD repeat protein
MTKFGRSRRRLLRTVAAAALAAFVPACGGGSDGGGGGGGITSSAPETTLLPTPASMANRTIGIAPLSVFFTAINASMTWNNWPIVQPADEDYGAFHYEWNFGDAASGTWPTSGRSRNLASGFTACHVYDTPGTYMTTLTVRDAAGTVHLYTEMVEVLAFTGSTRYVSDTDGNDANDGLSPATPWKTVAKAVQNAAPNRRLLFKRGDTFPTMGNHVITPAGPSFLGAYGAGAKPLIQVNGSLGGFTIFGSDWRIEDLALASTVGAADMKSGIDLANSVQVMNTLIRRVDVTAFRVGFGNSDTPAIYATPHDGISLVECTASGAEVNGVYLGGRRLALLGNSIQNIVTSHVVRVWQADHGVISHNVILNPGGNRHALKLHGPSHGDGRPPTRGVTVTDNQLRGKEWTIRCGPQDTLHDERVSHVLFERNVTSANPGVQIEIILMARYVTVRNNVFVGTGASNFWTGVGISHPPLGPAPVRIRVLNNTLYRPDAASEFQVASVTAACSEVTVRNNLASAPLTTTKTIVLGNCPALVVSHNTLSNTPGFVNAGAGDFHLTAASPGFDTGIDLLQVGKDFDGVLRPVGVVTDQGAFEQ